MKNPLQNSHVSLPRSRKLLLYPILSALGAGVMVLGSLSQAQAQSDNFDSYSNVTQLRAGGWFLSSLNPALVTTTFPAVGSGKGLRIQANPVPNTAPAVGTWYRTNEYTNFFVSIDIANWPGTDKNQALVLFGRLTDTATGTVTTNINPANSQGIICNYDASQFGENPGDRRQGQFQMNIVGQNFATITLAAAEVTLQPGRGYRMSLSGVDQHFVAKIYDLQDLTKPVVVIEADSPPVTYTFGACGVLSFSRAGTTGTADATYDNYFASVSDPNVAPAPVLAHPIPGTPQVVTRNPTNRFTNFHPVASEISFTAQTFATNEINASATKLYLNGVDASASLAPLPANGTSASFAAAAGTLSSNTVYSARIELQDTTGNLKSTNTFWFDTFTDAYLTNAPVKTIEAEDYNYSGGSFQLDPIPVSGVDTNGAVIAGFGTGYYGAEGLQDIDYSKPGGFYANRFVEYRSLDRVQITQGSWYFSNQDDEAGDIVDFVHGNDLRIHDTQRARYAALSVYEYQVRLTSPGDWMNYTRSFAATNYNVYLRCATFGATEVYLDQVTSDITTSNQTTVRLGTFKVDNNIMRLNYRYIPLTVGSAPVVLNLSGTNTLRLTLGGTAADQRKIVMDYLLFVPTSQGPTIFDNFNDGNDSANPPWDRYDPLAGVTITNSSFLFTNGGYRIFAPGPGAANPAGPARAGSFLRNAEYTDFYVSVDIIDFDDTVRQAFGLAARITTPGLGTTDGYIFTWEPGGGTLPGTGGDLDISILVGEQPVGQIETTNSGLHLTRGKSYRFVFMGKGNEFEGQVYELPDLSNPLKRLPAIDPSNLYPSGRVGLISASQSSFTVSGDATFDNFLATTDEPRLAVNKVGNVVSVSWPNIPYRLQTTSTLSPPNWTDVTTGIVHTPLENTYSVGTPGAAYFRLVYP